MVRIWELPVRRELLILRGHIGAINSVAFSPDGHRVVAGGANGTIHLWDADTGQPDGTLDAAVGPIEVIAFAPNGQRLAAGGSNAMKKSPDALAPITIWDVSSRQKLQTLPGHKGGVMSVGFVKDGHQLISSGRDKKVVHWNAASGNIVRTTEAPLRKNPNGKEYPEYNLEAATVSPDGRWLVIAKWGQFALYESESGRELDSAFYGSMSNAKRLAFNPSGSYLAVSSGGISTGSGQFGTGGGGFVGGGNRQPSQVTLWGTSASNPVFNLRGHGLEVTGMAFSSDGTQMATSGRDETVQVWDTTGPPDLVRLRLDRGLYSIVALSRDGSRVAAAVDASRNDRRFDPLRNQVTVWDVAFRKELGRLSDVEAVYGGLKFTGSSAVVVATSDALILWDVDSGRTVRVKDPAGENGRKSQTRLLAASSNGRQAALGNAAGLLQLINLTAEARPVPLKHPALHCTFSPDGRRLAATGVDSIVHIYDTSTYKEVLSVRGDSQPISVIEFSPDGKRIAGANSVGKIHVWDATSGSVLNVLTGQMNYASTLVFSADSERLLSGGSGIMVWDLVRGQPLLALGEGIQVGERNLAIDPSGYRLLAAVNGEVWMWDGSPQER